MKRLVLALLLAASTAQATQTDMHEQAYFKATTGDLWLKLYKETLYETECSTTSTTLYSNGLLFSYASVTLGSAFTSFTPGALFSGSYDGPYSFGTYNPCDGTQRYYLWSNGNETLEHALLDWAASSDPTITIYVGRFSGAGIETTETDCQACVKQELYGHTTLKLSDNSEPYWEAPAAPVTSAPSGCRPECSLSGAKPAAAMTWGEVKGMLYR
jgi:hypothetical protein